MKHQIFLIIILLLTICNFNLAHTKIDPIILNHYDINKLNDNFFIMCDKGIILIADSSFSKLTKQKLFNYGRIINIFYHNNYYLVFNEKGEIGYTENLNKDWNVKKIDINNVLSVIDFDDKFLLRSVDKLIILDKDLNTITKYDLFSDDLKQYTPITKFDYKYSLLYLDNNLIVETDSSKFLIFDKNLQIKDSFQINIEKIKPNNHYVSGYRLMKDSCSMYITNYVYDSTKLLWTYLLSTKDLKTFEIIGSMKGYYLFKVINNQIYYTTFNEKFIDTNLLSFNNQEFFFAYVNFNNLFNDFFVDYPNMYIVGNKGVIEQIDLRDFTINVISEQYWIDETRSPIILNDNKLIFLSGFNYKTNSAIYPYFYRSSDLIKYNSTIKKSNPNYNDSLMKSRFFLYCLDNMNNITFFGKYDFEQSHTYAKFFSDDTLKSFKIDFKFDKDINLNYGNVSLEIYSPYLSNSANASFKNPILLSLDDTTYYYVSNSTFHPVKEKDFTSFTILDKDYNPIDRYLDSTFIIDFVHLKSFDKFLVHCANMIESGRSEIKYTNDKGKVWEYLHKYNINDTLISKYYVKLKENEYLLLFHYDGEYTKTKMYFDVVDLKEYSWKRIKMWDLTKEKEDFTNLGIYSSGEELTFAIGDTLYYIQDLYNLQSWRYRILPDSGKMFDPIVKYKDKFISNFKNKNGYYGLSLISFSDTTLLSVKDYTLEKRNYLYLNLTYPMPAKDQITIEIYWDTGLNIENALIKIYNIYGKEIESAGDIKVIPESNWYGKLIWNCQGIEPGIYIILINYGTERKAIKVIKE